MTQPTSPDNIVKWTLSDPGSIAQASQAMGDSVQTALDNRQRYDYEWVNAAARDAQTGMGQGSRGYQIDTKSEYLFDNSNWRLAVPYAEFTSATSTSLASGNWGDFGTISVVSAASTDVTFATASTNIVTLVNPGVYSISAYVVGNITMTGGSSFCVIGSSTLATSDIAYQLTRGDFPASSRLVMMVLPFYYTSASNQQLYFYWQNNTGTNRTITATIRIGRLA